MRSVAKRLVRLGLSLLCLWLFATYFRGDGAWVNVSAAAPIPCPTVTDPLATAPNAIVCENRQPGTPDTGWDIVGAGASNIQGFATDISVNHGTTVSFKINVTDGAAYHLDIYRLGYYGGMGARNVARVPATGSLNGIIQPAACLTDASTGLVDCGNWVQTLNGSAILEKWDVPATATSGIYFAKAVRDTGPAGASHIYFIVRDDASTSDVLFQTSDTTWQAYNSYGGNSLYVGGPGNSPGRAYKVSYNRPIITRGSADSRTFLFSSEFPMLRWLEANGYDVSYFTGVDSDRNGALIKNHKAFLSIGHDEYWSGGQRTNVEAARDAGVHLAFFSGNEVFWKTRWENGIGITGAPYRTLVTYKESHPSVRLDPLSGSWTGSWRDPRFSVAPTLDGGPVLDGGRPENALSGTIFTANAALVPDVNGNLQPVAGIGLTVPAADGKMRFWRNTTIATLAAGTSTTFTAGALGYEFDEDLDNGARPAGLFHLSTTTAAATEHIVDYGHTYATAPATHHLTTYRRVTGTKSALVFGAGSIQFSWGLDSDHDGFLTPPADVRLQQATVNLFADMGFQPGSLQSGLLAATASGDLLPPASTINPIAGPVQVGTPLTVSGTAIDFGVGNNTSPPLLGVVAGVEVSVDGGSTWHPADGRENWTFTWVPVAQGPTIVKSRAVDDSGNLETTAFSSNQVNVTVLAPATPTCPCSIWSAPPAPAIPAASDIQALELGVRFHVDTIGFLTALRFYKAAGDLGTHVGHLWSNAGTLLGTANFTNETASGWQEAALTSVTNPLVPVAVTANTTYVASFSTSAGWYAADPGYFAAKGQDNFPLHALRDGIDGRNGVFGSANFFPTSTSVSSNYWVDVVFNTSLAADTTPPIITGVTATPGSGGTATIRWTTNEPSTSTVSHGTAPGALTSIVSDGTLVTQHVVTLTGMAPNTIHYFHVTSSDAANNAMTSPDTSFTMPGAVLTDTTVADFSAGTPGTATYVSETANGEVILAPAAGTEFGGSALPTGWVSAAWSGSDSPVVNAGSLILNGERANMTAGFAPGRSVEFVATFGAETFQHVGLVKDDSFATRAIFSTKDTTGSLYARTSDVDINGNAINTTDTVIPGGPWIGSSHRYRIDWNASQVVFWVDGIVQATHLVALTAFMRPIASDIASNGTSLSVDWVRVTPYSSAGDFSSRIFNAGAPSTWSTLSWTSQGSGLTMSVHTGNTPTPDGSWTPFQPIALGGSIGTTSQYLQYRASLTTTDVSITPALQDVTIGFTAGLPNSAPVAAAQSVTTPEDSAKTITLSATDVDNTSLTGFSIVATPPNGSLGVVSAPTCTPSGPGSTCTATVIYTPSSNYNGGDSFTFKASDSTVDSNVATVSITVTAVNDPPVVTNPGAKTNAEGDSVTLAIVATDPDSGDTLTYSATGLPTSLAINSATGQITGTIGYTAAASSPFSVTVTATDPSLATGSAAFAWTVTNTNRAPVLAAIGNKTVAENATLTITPSASDPDGDTLTYTTDALPAGATFLGGVFSWTPTFARRATIRG